MADAHKNFATSLVATAPSPATSGTSLVVTAADGAKFPTPPFNAPVWPAGVQPTTANAEIVRVTAISTDTFTIVRQQEGTSARTIVVGDQIGANITAKTLTDVEDTFAGKVFDTRVTGRDILLGSSSDYFAEDTLENSGSYILELPSTSSLEVVPIVKQAEVQSYFGLYDFIESGCVWTADNAGSSLNGTMSDGYVWISGRRLRVNAVRSHAFTASKDTYVDFSDAGNGTATVTYTETTNNLSTGSPTLAPGSLRNAIVVTAAGSIAASTSINQGQETMILPIVSSVAYSVTDSLGNLICPRDPTRRLLGYRQITSAFNTASLTAALVTGLLMPIIIPLGRKADILIYARDAFNATAAAAFEFSIWDTSISGTQLNATRGNASPTQAIPAICTTPTTPATSARTYVAGLLTTNASDAANIEAASTYPAYIKALIS